ncbi:MAG: ribosomal protein S18-alanine N-acetyltransferase [Anaerolineae bacterium]
MATETRGLCQCVCIRPMRIEDVERVAVIEQLSFSLPWPPDTYRRDLGEDSLAHYLVCECDEEQPQLVGYIGYWLIEDEAHISTIAVHPDYRRLGLGELLLANMLDDAIKRGARSSTLEVRLSNTAAQALYLKYGFRVTGKRRRYYRDNNEDALVMTIESLTSGEFKGLFSRRQQALRERLGARYAIRNA